MIWTALWLAWIAAFFAIEVPALFDKDSGATLSAHVWAWFAVKDHERTAWVRLRRWFLLAFVAWLSLHFLTGGWA